MQIGTGQACDASAPQSRIVMTPDEDSVRPARGCTDTLSDQEHWDRGCASWAEFHGKHGCVADEYDTDFRPDDTIP